MGSKNDAQDEGLLTNPGMARKMFWSTECVTLASRKGHCVVCLSAWDLWLDLFNIQYKKICSRFLKFYFMTQRISADVISINPLCHSLGTHTRTHTMLQ